MNQPSPQRRRRQFNSCENTQRVNALPEAGDQIGITTRAGEQILSEMLGTLLFLEPTLCPALGHGYGEQAGFPPAHSLLKSSPPHSPPPNLTPLVRHPNQFSSFQKCRAGKLTQGKCSPQLRPQPSRLELLLLPALLLQLLPSWQITQPTTQLCKVGTKSRGGEWLGTTCIPSSTPLDPDIPTALQKFFEN